MAATRKLQAEIDRCLKKVGEGVEKFDDTWNKVHHASNSNQKEKYEEDLKKEIKKLQRLRDQIKTWIASAEIKDKSVLYEKRKLIEGKMEKFKIVERETKTKAYSKEGLTSGHKLDPAERERYEISQWLNSCIEKLNIQMDQFEAEIETLGMTKKKKGRNDQSEQIDQLNTLLEKHRDHVQKLETLLRMLDNETVDINQIKDIKEDVEYYIDNCQEPEFMENDMIYEDIDGLEEMLIDVSMGANEHNTNSVEASETMSTNSASSPVPSYTSHNHSNDMTTSNDINVETKRRHKSSSDDSKVGSQSTSSTVSKPLQAASAQAVITPTAVSSSSSMAASQQPPPPSLLQQTSSTSSAVPAAASVAMSLATNPPTSQVIKPTMAGPSSNSSAVANSNNNNNNNSLKNSTSNVVNNVPASPVSGSAVSSLPSSPPASALTAASGATSSTPIKAPFNAMVAANSSAVTSPAASAPQPPPGMNGSPASASSAVTLAGPVSPPTSTVVQTSLPGPAGFPPSTGLQPLQPQRQEQQNFAAAVQHLNGHAPSLNDARSVPSPAPSLPGSAKQPTSQSSHFPGASSTNDKEAMPMLKSLAQEATNRAGLKVPISAQQTQMSISGTAAPPSTGGSSSVPGSNSAGNVNQVASAISQSGLFQQTVKDRSQKTEAHIPPLMGVAPLGPVPLNKETQMQYAMLEAAYLHMPHPSDSERLRPYLPRNPCPTPSYYPQLPPAGSDEIEFFLRLSTETLFFIFYYMEGTKAQYLAAKALKKQSWRFHTKYLMWFQRHEEPKIINDEFEQGTYVYFDFEKWGQRKKEGFTFEYRFLEDRDLD